LRVIAIDLPLDGACHLRNGANPQLTAPKPR
jgi:hypothetical protein